jgi:hypothetical protein
MERMPVEIDPREGLRLLRLRSFPRPARRPWAWWAAGGLVVGFAVGLVVGRLGVGP